MSNKVQDGSGNLFVPLIALPGDIGKIEFPVIPLNKVLEDAEMARAESIKNNTLSQSLRVAGGIYTPFLNMVLSRLQNDPSFRKPTRREYIEALVVAGILSIGIVLCFLFGG